MPKIAKYGFFGPKFKLFKTFLRTRLSISKKTLKRGK